MMKACETFVDQLVDYVDGELPQDEAKAVAEHLAVCESCRHTAAALERSLGLANVIWSDNLGRSEPAARPAPAWKSRRMRSLAVAASILIAAAVLVITVSNRRGVQPAISFEEVEQQIARAGAAAELLAATKILARCDGTEDIVERQHQFILTEYAGTPAAESIRAEDGSR
jgi:anti-sigma factor RsiW